MWNRTKIHKTWIVWQGNEPKSQDTAEQADMPSWNKPCDPLQQLKQVFIQVDTVFHLIGHLLK